VISLGASHGLVLVPDGSMWSWGGQDSGWPVLGLGKMNLTASLVRIGSQTDWAYVSAGEDHNLVLKSDGTVWAWGANYRGQLGDGNWGTKLTNGLPNLQDRPVQTVAGSDWVKVEAGSVASYGLKRDGSLWAWGRNALMLTGAAHDVCEIPTQIGHDTDWQSVCASKGSLGHLLRKRHGTFWRISNPWENNPMPVKDRVAMPPNIVAWGAGGGAIAAITQDGEIWTCGAVLGQHGPKYRFLQSVEELCWRLGWKVRWQYDRPRIVREQPWQLRNVDPGD
jgi:alpha-tubulin suppressor-like RCC1 family protein